MITHRNMASNIAAFLVHFEKVNEKLRELQSLTKFVETIEQKYMTLYKQTNK